MLCFKNHMFFTFNENLYRKNISEAKKEKKLNNIEISNAHSLAHYKDQILMYLRDGNNVCICPELYTSFDGITAPIDPVVGEIVEEARCTLVTFRLTGAYFAKPAWTPELRKGLINASVINVYSVFDLRSLSVNQINTIIKDDLKEDAYARQCNSPLKYTGNNLAKGLENVFWKCPTCGEYDSYVSSGNDFNCTKCEARGSYTDIGIIHSNNRYKTVTDWMRWEEACLDRIGDSELYFETPDVNLYEIKENHKLEILKKAALIATCEHLKIDDYVFNHKEIEHLDLEDYSNTIVFSHNDHIYILTSPNLRGIKYRRIYLKYHKDKK